MVEQVRVGQSQVAAVLHAFVESEVLPGLGLESDAFWRGFDALLHDLAPVNRRLLARREALQAEIDAWHRARRGRPIDAGAYRAFLADIGYLAPEGPDFSIETSRIDEEIATIAGPQLVVPATNARYALNAANARWGSLYDALYGTDAIPEDGGAARGGGYNPARGARVIAWTRAFLDEAAPLAAGIEQVHRKHHVLLQHPVPVGLAVRVPEFAVDMGQAEAVEEDERAVRIGHAGLAVDLPFRLDPEHRARHLARLDRSGDGDIDFLELPLPEDITRSDCSRYRGKTDRAEHEGREEAFHGKRG